MRRVQHNSTPVPLILGSDEAAKARVEIAIFLDRSDEERSTRRAPLQERFFRSPEVRKSLEHLFHGKCAYCEDRSEVSVEHHRPPANASGGRKSAPDHYSWLAYEWENLLLICAACNRRKASRFPLRGSRAPVLAEFDEVRARESPVLIDPGYDRPEWHLAFTIDGRCHPRTDRGAGTIELLELNRPSLIKMREHEFRRFTSGVLDANSPTEVLALMLSIEADQEFYGALLILRYRYAVELAKVQGLPVFPFDDTRGGLGMLHADASMRHVNTAFSALGTIDVEPQVNVPSGVVEIPAWRGFSAPMRRVEIRNFKAIESLDLEFPVHRKDRGGATCMMILGENATGKSSILEAIALTLAGTKTASTFPVSPRELVRRPPPGSGQGREPARVTIFFVEGGTAELRIPVDGSRFEGNEEASANVQAYGSRRFFLKGRRKRAKSGGMRGLFDPLWVLPHPDLWLGKLEEKAFREVARALREILGLPDDSDFRRDRAQGVLIVSKATRANANGVSEHVGETGISIEQHSEGYRSLSATAVDVIRAMLGSAPDLAEAEGVVLIDEIETHLHPRWKMRVMAALRTALPKVQFIATTHDPLCLRGMDDGEVQVLVRDQDTIERLIDLPSVTGMRAEQLLTSEFFGLGSTDPETDSRLIRYQNLASRHHLDDDETAEKAELGQQLQREISVGNSFADQIFVEALRRADIDPFMPPAKVRAKSRRDMVETLLGEIDSIKAGFARSRP